MTDTHPPATHPYDFETRPEMAQYVPTHGRVLEVGCSSGGFGYTLRTAGHVGELWGIEPDPTASETARQHFDHVITDLYPTAALDGEQFDTIVFNDVLEHLLDPWDSLRHTASLLNPGGCVVASIPNIRYWPVLRGLAFNGNWTYTDTGTLDRTHLRFFTRETINDMFDEAGYDIARLVPINLVQGGRVRTRYIRWLPDDVRALQYAVVARKR